MKDSFFWRLDDGTKPAGGSRPGFLHVRLFSGGQGTTSAPVGGEGSGFGFRVSGIWGLNGLFRFVLFLCFEFRVGGLNGLFRSEFRVGGLSSLFRSEFRVGGLSSLLRSEFRVGGPSSLFRSEFRIYVFMFQVSSGSFMFQVQMS